MGYMSRMFVDTQRHHDHLMERNKIEGRKGNVKEEKKKARMKKESYTKGRRMKDSKQVTDMKLSNEYTVIKVG